MSDHKSLIISAAQSKAASMWLRFCALQLLQASALVPPTILSVCLQYREEQFLHVITCEGFA